VRLLKGKLGKQLAIYEESEGPTELSWLKGTAQTEKEGHRNLECTEAAEMVF